jgi:hypothetical protein
MSLESTYTPITGLEAKKLLKSMMNERIDKIPYLKEGNAFKQIEIGFELIFSAYPPDCPVPVAEWQTLIGLPEGEDAEFDKDKKKLELLMEKRNQILENVERIDKFLEKYAPREEYTDIEKDNGIPDELRLAHNLPLPMIQTSKSGTRTEVSVPANSVARSK